MAKDSSHMKSRAAKRLEPYKDPTNCSTEQSGNDCGSDRSSGGLSRSSHAHSLHLSSEPLDWAKELLKQQQANATEWKHQQREMVSSKFWSAQKSCAADLEFCFACNKKQWHLNKEVLDKIHDRCWQDL